MRLKNITAFSLVALVLVPASGGGEVRMRTVYIQADRLFDGRTMQRGRVAVAVRGGRIVAAGRLRLPRSGRVLRFSGGTILPGFIDLHVHSTWPSMLRAGVTTTRNLGEPEAVLRPPYALPRYPRVFSSGPLITVPGGYPTRINPSIAAPVRSAAEAERKVDASLQKEPPSSRSRSRRSTAWCRRSTSTRFERSWRAHIATGGASRLT